MSLPSSPPLRDWRCPVFIGGVVAGPALLLWQLHGLWNPQGDYAYGWVVPALAAYLAFLRWEDHPAASAPSRYSSMAALCLALLIPPARWLQEAAPERALCAWVLGLAAAGAALCLLAEAGGRAWAGWFAFPVGFTLTAIPWPHGIERFLTDTLMGRTAWGTVEVLCLLGMPSTRAGNLVHIENGIIDIDEACSGVRSLQAMVMLSLFLGELFRLRPWRRALLLAIGLLMTVGANVARTAILSGIGEHYGMGAVDRAHDAAGLGVLCFPLAGTLAAAWLLRGVRGGGVRVSSADCARLSWRTAVALLAWLAAGETGVEAWYRAHERPWQGWRYEVVWPRELAGFQFTQMPHRARQLLACDESGEATWEKPGGGHWTMYALRWNPGNPAAEAAKVHRPEVCLNAEGAILDRDGGTQPVAVGGGEIPFRAYAFSLAGRRLYVFFAMCEEIGPDLAWNTRFEQVDMLARALAGRRRGGVQSFEVALSGYPTEAAALAAFREAMPGLIAYRGAASAYFPSASHAAAGSAFPASRLPSR